MIGCPSAEVDSEPRTRLAAAAARHVNLPNETVTCAAARDHSTCGGASN
jgi:hypothetical protein